MIIISKKKLSEMNNNSTEKNIIQESQSTKYAYLISYTASNGTRNDAQRYTAERVSDKLVELEKSGCRDISIKVVPYNTEGLTEDVDDKTFEVQYTVKHTDKVSAKSASEAQQKIRDKYKDQTVMITSTKEVEDDVDDLTEDLAQDVAMDDAVDEISSDNRGFAGVINDLIIDEYDAINGYNGAIETAKVMGLETASKLLQDISDEETRHIGELQELMKTITPQAHEIENGGREAAEKLADFSEGVDDSVDGAIGANSPLWKQTNATVLDNVDDDIMGIESYL